MADNHTIEQLAHNLQTNTNLSETLRTNLATLATTLNTTDDNKAKISIDTFHQDDASVTTDSQALDLITFASQRMDVIVEPNITADMSEVDRITEIVRANEATNKLISVKDSIGFIGCTSYNTDGTCASTSDGII